MAKRKKGMTLMEVVISMAIYGLIALLIVEIMTVVNSTIRSTDQLNERLSYEAKYADNLLTTYSNGDPLDTPDPVGFVIYYYDPSVVSSKEKIDMSIGTPVALEYTVRYKKQDDETVGTVFHKNMNYRFMTFSKTGHVAEGNPGEFTIEFRLVPYFSGDYALNPGETGYKEELAKQFEGYMNSHDVSQKAVWISKAKDNIKNFTKIDFASSTVILPGQDNDVIFKSGTSQIMFDHTFAEYADTANWSDQTENKIIGVQRFKVTPCPTTFPTNVGPGYPGSTISNTLIFEAFKTGMTNRYSHNEAIYNLYVRSATADLYYKKCIVEYNVNTGVINTLKSE